MVNVTLERFRLRGCRRGICKVRGLELVAMEGFSGQWLLLSGWIGWCV